MSRKKQSKAKVRGGTKVKLIKATVSDAIERPTPEQERRVEFERRSVRSEMGQTIGVAYRRRPLFETMADKGGTIAPNELEALRYYRTSFDRAERSATKSCLNFGVGGRSAFSDIANVSASMIDAKRRIAICESVLGPYLPTMRAVVLEDRPFTDIAIERFGGRPQSWIIIDEPVLKDGKPVIIKEILMEDGKASIVRELGPLTRPVHREKIVPRSGRHRAIVADEFRAGLKLLAAHLIRMTNMGGAHELWVEVNPDGSAQLVHGACAPARRYRWWGSKNEIAETKQQARKLHSADGVFTNAAEARDAVDQVNEARGCRLHHLDPEELAA